MRKNFLRLGTILAGLAVILGAFGAHTLKEYLSPEQLSTFQTGVQYQFYHSFAILALGIWAYMRKTNAMRWAGWLFAGGILLFSGSLYGLSLAAAANISMPWLGPITPVGGLLFIAGWVMFLVSTYQEGSYTTREKTS